MNNVHIRIEYADALNSKKNALQIQESLLKATEHLRKYNSLRKVEFSLKNKIRQEFLELNKLLISLQEHFPKEEASFAELVNKKSIKTNPAPKIQENKQAIKIKKVEKTNSIQSELEEIRRKLAQLS